MNPDPKSDFSAEVEFARVVEIMRRLRAPGGCPWDREQTLDSIRPHTLEEAYEVLEAIGDRNWEGLREELGDLLLQVVFYAEIAQEQGLFGMGEVLRTLADKLIRRHPHVFSEPGAAGMSAAQALGRWNAIKAEEKGPAAPDAPRSLLDGIPRGLPALAEAGKMGQRAARVGFDWPGIAGVLAKVEEEMAELRREIDVGGGSERLEDELGDVLFSLANLARQLNLEPESALKRANRKFSRRFQGMETAARQQGRDASVPDQFSAEQWDELWVQAKREAG